MPHRDKWLKILLTEQELTKLEQYAEHQGWNKSQAVREWIKGLPETKLLKNGAAFPRL